MVDFADVIGTAADATANWLLQAPDSLAFWLTFDLAALGFGPVIVESFSGVSPPDRPMVLTFYANCSTQEQMKAGGVDASSEENLEWGSYVAIDQIASYFAKGIQFSDELRPYYEDADGNAVQFSIPFISDAGGSRRRVPARTGPVPDPDGIPRGPNTWNSSRPAGRPSTATSAEFGLTEPRSGRPLRVIRPAQEGDVARPAASPSYVLGAHGARD